MSDEENYDKQVKKDKVGNLIGNWKNYYSHSSSSIF